MDVQPKDESPLNRPPEQQQATNLPSFELFNMIMQKPRDMADYFNKTIFERFPSGGLDVAKDASCQQTDRKTSRELDTYQNFWLPRILPGLKDEYSSFVATSFDMTPKNNELLFHTINQYVEQQWQRVLVSTQYPKMDSADLHTAQIQLAIESMHLLIAQNDFEPADLTNNQLRDMDAMIKLLQLSIDGVLHNQSGIITLPHPEMGRENRRADFLIFEPTHDNSFNKIEVVTSDIIDADRAPGFEAVEILTGIRINSISRRPEFQERSKFHKFVLAHKSARQYQQRLTPNPSSEPDIETR